MKVLVCGDRNWFDPSPIRQRLEKLPRTAIIIHGGARGADRMAGEIADELGFGIVKVFFANWAKYGRAAGPIRNIQMLGEAPDLVIAFHENLGASRGTAHTVREARKRNIPVEVISG